MATLSGDDRWSEAERAELARAQAVTDWHREHRAFLEEGEAEEWSASARAAYDDCIERGDTQDVPGQASQHQAIRTPTCVAQVPAGEPYSVPANTGKRGVLGVAPTVVFWGAIIGVMWAVGGGGLVMSYLSPWRPVNTETRAAILKTQVKKENAHIQDAVKCMPRQAVVEFNAITLRGRADTERAAEQIKGVSEDDLAVKILTNPTTMRLRKERTAFVSRYATKDGRCR